MEYKLEQVKVDDESLTKIENILRISFPKSSKFTLNYLKWQYVYNPVGQIIGFNALNNGILAAHYVAMPIFMKINGENVKGLLSLNTATHPDHRGKRLFSILANETYSYGSLNGYKFVIGVANNNSTHGFIKNLGFSLISPLTVKIGFGNIIKYTNQFPYSVYWNKETLNWRLQNPCAKYYFKDGIIFSPLAFPSVKCIMGFLPNDFQEQINFEKINSGLRPFNLFIGLGADLSKGKYFEIPTVIKRPPFNLIFKDLTGKIPKIKKEDIFFQLIDFDVK